MKREIRLNKESRDLLSKLTPCRPWLVGGAVRNSIRGKLKSRDLDVVVEEYYYEEAIDILRECYQVEASNRHGNKRFTSLDYGCIDIWSPERFFDGYASLPEMLEYVDYSCNAVAFSLTEGMIMKEGALYDIDRSLLRPIEKSWVTRDDVELAHLIGRGVKFVLHDDFSPINQPYFLRALECMDIDTLISRYGVTENDARKILVESF